MDVAELEAISQQIKSRRSAAEAAEAKRVRIRAKEKRKKDRRVLAKKAEEEKSGLVKPDRRKRRGLSLTGDGDDDILGQPEQREKIPRRKGLPRVPVRRQRPSGGPPPRRGRPRAKPLEEVPPEEECWIQPAAPRLDEAAPGTPQDLLPELETLPPEEPTSAAAQDAPAEPPGPPPAPCSVALAAWLRHSTEELPRDSSARENAIGKVATHLGTRLKLEDLNVFLREVQLRVLEKRGNSRSSRPFVRSIKASSVFDAKPGNVPNRDAPRTGVQSYTAPEDPFMPRVRALCRDMRDRWPVLGKDGRLAMGNLRRFLRELLAIAGNALHWEVAWQYMGLGTLPDEERDQAGLILVDVLLELVSEFPACTDRAAAAIADLSRSFRLKLRTVETAVRELVLRVGGDLQLKPGVAE
ncbi:unnamed protein product, partial [Polarella glacialis]